MLATCAPGDAVLLVRNCHRAATAALALAGAWPEWLEPAFDPELGVAEGVAAAEVRRRLRELQGPGGTRRVGAVLVVSPTYFGACTNDASDKWGGSGIDFAACRFGAERLANSVGQVVARSIGHDRAERDSSAGHLGIARRPRGRGEPGVDGTGPRYRRGGDLTQLCRPCESGARR